MVLITILHYHLLSFLSSSFKISYILKNLLSQSHLPEIKRNNLYLYGIFSLTFSPASKKDFPLTPSSKNSKYLSP